MPQSRLIAALDVGTTKICALVAEIQPGGELRLLGAGQCQSEGMRKGVVVDIAAASRNIREAVDKAAIASGAEIGSVVVGVTGEHISSQNSRGTTSVGYSGREITELDVQRVSDGARTLTLPAGREVIQVVPRGFTVDGQPGILRPVGMSGARLEMEAHIVTGSSCFLQNVYKSVEGAGLLVEALALEPIATSDAVLTVGERELGAAVLDIGGGTTDVVVVRDGSVCHTTVVPVGGNHVTHDLAVGLRTSRHAAEALKINSGSALVSLVVDNDLVEVPGPGGTLSRPASRRAIAEIIEPRMYELFDLVRRELERARLGSPVTSIVLSGGGSLLHGAPELAEAIFDAPVRIGRPRGVTLGDPDLESPIYATGVGLLHFGVQQAPTVADPLSTRQFVSRAFHQFREWFAHYFS